MKKSIGKIVTKDIALINAEVKKYSLEDKLQKRISKFIYGVKAYLGSDYIIKGIGSYTMEGIYSFEGLPKIDLLAIKYLNRDFYKRYDDENDSENHFLDCLCCFHTKVIQEKLEELFETKDHIEVIFNSKVYVLDEKRKLTYMDSVLVNVKDDEDNIIFTISIRVGICSKELPVIICDERIYRRSFALQATTMYSYLNNLLNKKLKYLFLLIKKEQHSKLSKKEIMYIKLKIMSDLQLKISYDEHTSEWLSKVYKETLNNKSSLKKVLKKKDLHYNSQKIFNRVHKMVSLKEMKWVFNRSYQSLDTFIDTYLKFAKVNYDIKEEAANGNFLYCYYDSNIYIDEANQISFTVKKNNRLFDYISIKKNTKSVYPSLKEIENVVLFLQYYAMNIYYVNNKYAKY